MTLGCPLDRLASLGLTQTLKIMIMTVYLGWDLIIIAHLVSLFADPGGPSGGGGGSNFGQGNGMV